MNPVIPPRTSSLHPTAHNAAPDAQPAAAGVTTPEQRFSASGHPLPAPQMSSGQAQQLLRRRLNRVLQQQIAERNAQGWQSLHEHLPELLQSADALQELNHPPLAGLLDEVESSAHEQLTASEPAEQTPFRQIANDITALRQAAHFAGYSQLAGLPEAGVLMQLQQMTRLDAAALPQAASSEGLRQFLQQASENSRGLLAQLSQPLDLAAPLVSDEKVAPLLEQAGDLLTALRPTLNDAHGREAAEDLQQNLGALRDALLERRAADEDVFVDAPETPDQANSAMQKLGEKFTNTLHRTDGHAALSQRDDAGLKTQLRGEYAEQVDQMIQDAGNLDGVLQNAGLPPAAEKAMRKANNNILSELKALRHGVPLTERAWRGALTLAAYPLPLAVSLVTNEKEYSSTLIPHFVKNLLLLTGLLANDSTNHQSMVQHANNRLFVNGVVGLIYAGPAFINAMKPLHSSGAFSVGAGVVSGAATLGWFNQKAVNNALHNVSKKMRSLVFGAGEQEVTIRDDAKARVHEYIASLQNNRQLFAGIEQQYRGNGDKHLSDNLNSQLERTLSEMDEMLRIGKQMLGEGAPAAEGAEAVQDGAMVLAQGAPASGESAAVTEGAAAAEGATAAEGSHSNAAALNPDRMSKLGLTAFTGMICGGVVALMSDNPVGMVDYIVDGLWCTHEMYKQADNPNVNLQGAVQTFKELVGLNLTMIAYLSANKGYDFLHQGTGEYVAGTAAMTAANLTMPGIVGDMVGNSAGTALIKGSAALSSASQSVQGAFSYLSNRVSSAFTTPPGNAGEGNAVEMLPTEQAFHAAGDLEAQPVGGGS